MNIDGSSTTITLTLNQRFLIIGAILCLAMISSAVAIFAVPRVFAQTSDCPPQQSQAGISQLFTSLVEALGGTPVTSSAPTVPAETTLPPFTLRGISTATSITSVGCAGEDDVTDQFAPTDRIYIVADNGDFPTGTAIFARLSFEGRAIEDTNEIIADRDYLNTCVNLWFENSSGFEAGEYTIDLFINGLAAAQVSLEVQ